MKVAILIVGHLRTWSECKNNFLESFSHLHPDVFVSTYDLQYNYHPAGSHMWMQNMPDVILSDEEINSLFYGINLISLDIEKIDFVMNEYHSNNFKLHKNFQNEMNTFLQYKKISRAIKLLEEHELNMKSKYDVIIKIRPDIYHKKFEYNIPNNSVVISNCNVFPNDVIVASERDNFIKLFEFIQSEFYNQIYMDSHEKAPHNLLLRACEHNNFNIIEEQIMEYVIRRTGKNYYNNIR